jgi:hypothetical protein
MATLSTLKVAACRVNPTSITISFTEKVDGTSATHSGNYIISVPAAGFKEHPKKLGWNLSMLGDDDRTVVITVPRTQALNPGDWVTITVSGIETMDDKQAMTDSETIHRQVPNDAAQSTRALEDSVAYPVLTEEVSFPRSGGGPTTGVSPSQGGAAVGQTAALAIGDVLGWKVSGTDPKGFVGALTQAFTLTEVDGHVESTWNPRTYAVQTDLGGGITGAQASLYTRAKDALDQSLSLLDGLYPLDPDADPEYVKALREMARSQMTEIVREFGAVGLPSVLRIDTYFDILLGQNPAHRATPVEFDPDHIGGTLGELRKVYGIEFRGNRFNNSIEDEQDITNFRVISDYMTSLMQSWKANREFFFVGRPDTPAFFGTQLVLISRQLNVIAETVDEVRFALDSVFIGPNERQTLLLRFADHDFPPMFLEDVLQEIEKFVEDEGPRLLRDGGKISVTNNILPVVKSLKKMIEHARDPENRKELPDGFKTVRVRRTLDDLRDQLGELIKLTDQVKQQVAFPVDEFNVTTVSPHRGSNAVGARPDPSKFVLSVFGTNFERGAAVRLRQKHQHLTQPPAVVPSANPDFYSAERIDVTLDLTSGPLGPYDVTVINPDGTSITLRDRFTVTNGGESVEFDDPPTEVAVANLRTASGAHVAQSLVSAPPVQASVAQPTAAEQVSALQKQMEGIRESQAAMSKKLQEITDLLQKKSGEGTPGKGA